jgi:hypothetical protein
MQLLKSQLALSWGRVFCASGVMCLYISDWHGLGGWHSLGCVCVCVCVCGLP